MKYILIALALLSVSGCEEESNVYPYQIDEAKHRCSTNGGMAIIWSSPIYHRAADSIKHTEVGIRCNNGAIFRLRMVHPETR